MQDHAFEIRYELKGWTLFWAFLECVPDGEDRLAGLRAEVVRGARGKLTLESLSSHPPIAAMRKLFREAGCDPTRYRPSAEALLRRVLKGEELPALHPLVDINNCLSVELAVPCCVMREGTFSSPLVVRAGHEGESYESLRGPFNLVGKPVLADAAGPVDTPITGNDRVKVTPETRAAWLVAYLPVGAVDVDAARGTLLRLLEAAPVARASQLS